MRVLIGSTALAKYIPDVREAKDADYFTTDEADLVNKTPDLDLFYHPKLKEYPFGSVATLDELYTIKVSHSYWVLKNKSWSKHVYDIVQMKKAGAVLIPELHDLLYSIWVELHGAKKINLNLEPEEFFNKHVTRVYEHDTIHAAVAYYDEPLFNRILRDGHKVAVDKEKFFALPETVKHQLIREEVYATAMERQIIPSNFTANPLSAYAWALNKTITSFSKGWFPTYIVDNFLMLTRPDVDYLARFRENTEKLVPLKD